MNSYFSNEELLKIGFKSIGNNVLISRKASIYGAENISIGNNVRIDDFCILSGNIELHNYIHISAYSALFGGKSGIVMKDYSGISSRCSIYAESDDYSGKSMTNPMIPDELRGIISSKVVFEKHSIVGTGSSVLPGVVIGEGTSVGAMSLIVKSLESWGIYVGIPCRKIKNRDKTVIDLEKK